jgi:hypothetical protein
MAQVEGALQMHVEHGPPVILCHLCHRPIAQYARIVYQDIAATELFHSSCDYTATIENAVEVRYGFAA